MLGIAQYFRLSSYSSIIIKLHNRIPLYKSSAS